MRRFMGDYDEQLERATRDVVSRAIYAEMRAQQAQVGAANAERLRTLDAIRQEVADAFTLAAARRQAVDIARRRAATAQSAYDQDLKRARNLQGRPIEVLSLSLRSLTPGRDSVGQVFLQAKVDGKSLSGNGASTDIVEASVMAYLSAINKYLSVTETLEPPQGEEVTDRAPQLVPRQEEGRP